MPQSRERASTFLCLCSAKLTGQVGQSGKPRPEYNPPHPRYRDLVHPPQTRGQTDIVNAAIVFLEKRLTLCSADSFCTSRLTGMVVCGWHCTPPALLLGGSTGPKLLRESSLDLKGTMDSWLTLGTAVPSCNKAMLPLFAYSTTAYMPCRSK